MLCYTLGNTEKRCVSMNIYNVNETSYHTEDYKIKINGIEVTPDTARVFAVFFNRRRPGHQRQIEQSELVNFVSFSCYGEAVIEVTPAENFESYVIRPKSLGFKSRITESGSIEIIMTRPAYFTVEPFGRRNALHVFADPEKAYEKDENTINFGKGVHDKYGLRRCP